jgi:hypothetical protein
VSEAVCSGIFNDLGSGSNVDVCVITKVCYFNQSPSLFVERCLELKLMKVLHRNSWCHRGTRSTWGTTCCQILVPMSLNEGTLFQRRPVSIMHSLAFCKYVSIFNQTGIVLFKTTIILAIKPMLIEE